MNVRYHQLQPDIRDIVRSIESKGHAPYIRALLLKRVPFSDINPELARLGLAGSDESHYHTYFVHVLLPLLHKFKLVKYYSRYERNQRVEPLSFDKTFKTQENDRISFCKLLMHTEANLFFSNEIEAYYGSDMPLDEFGVSVFKVAKENNVMDVLLHERRHIIDGMLSQGYSPRMITQNLEDKYDVLISDLAVADYARSFMNIQRKSMEHAIEELYNEQEQLEKQVTEIKNNDTYTMGEKTIMISTIKNKLMALDKQIKHAQGAHNAGSFAAGVLEYHHIREMFADITERTYVRFKRLDEKSEYNVIPRLAQLTGVLAKATEKIIQLDTVMNETHKKSINEEMLEVITPSLERLEEEELEARRAFMELYAPTGIGDEELEGQEEIEILGVDEG